MSGGLLRTARQEAMRRPYEVGVSLAVLVGAGIDSVTAGYPPEVAEATPDPLMHAYGLWVFIGSLYALAGVLTRRPWSMRVERFGLLMQATGLGVLLAELLPPLCAGASVLAPSVVFAAVVIVAALLRAHWLTTHMRVRALLREAVGCG